METSGVLSFHDLEPIYQAAAQEWNVHPALLKAIAGQESGGTTDPDQAVSRAGAKGRMQIMDATAADLGVTDRSDPAQSIFGGAKYLSQMLDRYQKPELALAAYNAGPGRVDAFLAGKGPLPAETAAYVPAVAKRFQTFQTSTPVLPKATTTTAAQAAPDAAQEAPDAFSAALSAAQEPAKSGDTVPAADPFGDALAQAGKETAAAPQPAATTGSDTAPSQPRLDLTTPTANIATAAAQGAREAFGSDPFGMSPDTVNKLRAAGVFGPADGSGSLLQNLNEGGARVLAPWFDLGTRGIAALTRGAQAGIVQGGEEVGQPQLGRDLASIPDAFAGSPGHFAGNGPILPPNRLQAALTPAAVEAAPVNRLTSAMTADGPPPANMLPITPEAAAAVQRAGVTSEPLPSPKAAGADVTDPAAIRAPTKAEGLTNLQKSVTQSATDRAGAVMEDHTVYVPGVQRPLAARVFTPQNALDDKLFRATDPAYRAAAEKLERTNNEIMVDKLAGDAGDANALQAAHDARSAVAPPAVQLFDGEKPVNAQPWVDAIDKLLAGPEGKRSSVERTLKDIRAKLYDSSDNLETMPSQLYGARQNMTDILKKGAGVGDMATDAKLSKSVVTGLLDVADPIINEGAPKYQDYLNQFHEASQPINQMEWLQKYQTGSKKITDLQGNLLFSKVQKMLDDALQERSKAGANRGSALTDDQLDNIIAVRNELAANQLRDRMAAVKGSDSTQLVNRAGVLGEGPLGVAVKGAAGFLAHGAIMSNPATMGWGNAALGTYQSVISPAMKAAKIKRAAEALEARKAALLGTGPAEASGNLLTQP